MKQPLKWHGGKHYLAQQIVSLMPPHTHYVEPYAGGLAVLLAKPCEGISEVVSYLNGALTTFWRVLKDERLFRSFQRQVQAIPFSSVEWNAAQKRVAQLKDRPTKNVMLDMAVNFFVLCRQSLAGRCQDFATISRNRTRRGMNEQVAAWLTAIEGLPEVHARLIRVLILNQPALEVIWSQDGPDTLFYLDPPYPKETKSSDVFGELEMKKCDHEELLDTILQLKGKVMISSYPNALYEERLASWHRHDFKLPNNAASGVMKRAMNEVLWCNFSTHCPPMAKGGSACSSASLQAA
jgi:DNA adenine methylase